MLARRVSSPHPYRPRKHTLAYANTQLASIRRLQWYLAQGFRILQLLNQSLPCLAQQGSSQVSVFLAHRMEQITFISLSPCFRAEATGPGRCGVLSRDIPAILYGALRPAVAIPCHHHHRQPQPATPNHRSLRAM